MAISQTTSRGNRPGFIADIVNDTDKTFANGVNNGGVIVGQSANAAGEEKPVKWVWKRMRWPWE